MKHLEKLERILNGNLNKNPSRMTTLAALRYRHHPEVLRHLREESPDDQTIDEAFVFLEGETGERQEREAALRLLSDYVRSKFDDASDALEWLSKRDHRLSVWCAAQVARTVVHLAPDEPSKRPLRAIETTEAWVRGQATVAQLKAALNAADAASAVKDPGTYDIFNASYAARYVVAAALDAATNAPGSDYYPIYTVTRAARADRVARANSATYAASPSIDFVGVVADAILTFPVVIR